MRFVTVTVRCDQCGESGEEEKFTNVPFGPVDRTTYEVDLCQACLDNWVGMARVTEKMRGRKPAAASAPSKRAVSIPISESERPDDKWFCYDCERSFDKKQGLAMHFNRSGHDGYVGNQVYFGEE